MSEVKPRLQSQQRSAPASEQATSKSRPPPSAARKPHPLGRGSLAVARVAQCPLTDTNSCL
jgi:hypothetical protein